MLCFDSFYIVTDDKKEEKGSAILGCVGVFSVVVVGFFSLYLSLFSYGSARWFGLLLIVFLVFCLFFGIDIFPFCNDGEPFFDVLNYGYVKVHVKIVSSPV